ncbi:phospholipid-translocating P-type ATPase flippase family protein [Brugia pahangi]
MFWHQNRYLTSSHIIIGRADWKTSNYVSTTKYNIITFIPVFLFYQFKTFGNWFFLMICIVQFFPNLNPYGTNTTIVPLVIIILAAAAKEIFEDFGRLVADRRVNRQFVLICIQDEYAKKWKWKKIHWAQLKVGQVVKIMKNEFIPADIVLLSSSEPAGVAYIETSNLDGETNLKIRQALPQIAQIIDDDDRIMEFCSSLSKIECDPPNPALYEFHGVIKINNSSEILKKGNDENSKTNCSLGTNQLLPRGCKLQNTDWVYGVTVYTGRCTKLVLNTSGTRTKVSLVERITNCMMMIQFGFLVFMALFNACMGCSSINKMYYYLPYFHGNFRRLHILPTLVGLIIFYSGLIPISLNITLEMIQLFQAYFIQQDLNLYDKNSDIKAEVRSSNLNSQLGQVRYIISDKTGTLTQNKMRFKMCTIGGIKYGSMMTEKFTDEAILDDLINNAGNAKSIRDFLTLLAICHMVVPEKVINSELEKIIYHSPSPDEKALVKGAKDLKFIFHTRTPQCVYIEAMGKQEKYDILHILEFTSNRKRMGVIVRCPDRKLKLYIKGADSVIFPRLALNSDKYSVNKTAEHLVYFANLGLRTLCMAMCILSEEEYEKWEPGYHRASTALEKREMLIEEEAEKIEKNLELLGASAIEDKLQKGVKKTVEHLIEGGIIVWVLTGDKLETAQSIGYSCGLIDPFTPILVLGERNAEETANKINIYLENFANKKIKTSLIVSGESLNHALMKQYKMQFLHLASLSSTVICCRCSPAQKASVVKALKNWSDGTVLAIGDGANDVAMIQEADIGVGISGEEGLQASLAADYSIAQFRFLERLIFVHGAINYHRITKTILYFFYKNIVQTLTMFFYEFHTLFADSAIMDSWSLVMFNIFFTSWPPLAIGIWDRLFPFEVMIDYPALYHLSQNSEGFSLKAYFIWAFTGLVHATVISLIAYQTFKNDVIWYNGRVANYYVMGTVINIMSWIALFGSIIMLFIFFFSYSLTSPASPIIKVQPAMADTILHVLTSPVTYSYIIFVTSVSLSFDLIVKLLQRSLYRTIRDEVVSREFDVKQFNDLYYPLVKVKQIVTKASESALSLVNIQTKQRGYSFAQEDEPAISQSDVVRLYDSRMPKISKNR